MKGDSNGEFCGDAEFLLQPSTATAGGSFKLRTATELILSWISSIVVCLSNLFGQGSISKKIATSPTTESGHESSPAYKSIRIERMAQRRGEFGAGRDVEFAIESSRDHWSEVTKEGTGADTNKEIFEGLKKRCSSFFVDRGCQWVLGEKIAEGGQAEIFSAARAYPNPEGNLKKGYVLKVFKEKNALEYLQHQFPDAMLRNADPSHGFGFEHYAIKNIQGGVLLKDGRFAFEMWGDWGDLRKLIDVRMEQNIGNQSSPPFTDDEVGHILLDIARGMKQLHEKKIVHRGLKASNVLVVHYKGYNCGTVNFAPANDNFYCAVAEYECSHGVLGTGYWRAPEILRGVKNRNFKAHSARKQTFMRLE